MKAYLFLHIRETGTSYHASGSSECKHTQEEMKCSTFFFPPILSAQAHTCISWPIHLHTILSTSTLFPSQVHKYRHRQLGGIMNPEANPAACLQDDCAGWF